MRALPWLWLLPLAGCAAAPAPSADELLAAAVPGDAVRVRLAGDVVVSIAAPIDLQALPALARTTCDAVAPDGELRFCGWERGERGDGYRVEKAYEEPFPHRRSLLVAADGRVLERAHTMPLAGVPEHVLATALERGPFVDSAAIVSGPVAEEYWHVVVRDRRGHVFVCRVGLDGRLLASWRRHEARVDS